MYSAFIYIQIDLCGASQTQSQQKVNIKLDEAAFSVTALDCITLYFVN